MVVNGKILTDGNNAVKNGSRKLQLAKEKKHRLPLDCYRGRVRASFTLCIENKTAFFTEEIIVNKFLEILGEAGNKYDCKNWVYTFMPDHLHLVLEGNSEIADLWKTVVLFKQKTGFWLSKNGNGIRWQKDFYDHIHRKEEELRKHIAYILNNPVRKGLVDNWKDYPFKGSLDFELEEIIM